DYVDIFTGEQGCYANLGYNQKPSPLCRPLAEQRMCCNSLGSWFTNFFTSLDSAMNIHDLTEISLCKSTGPTSEAEPTATFGEPLERPNLLPSLTVEVLKSANMI
ncbi:Metalloendopeptidase, partial [Caligus rogercresseyi]